MIMSKITYHNTRLRQKMHWNSFKDYLLFPTVYITVYIEVLFF